MTIITCHGDEGRCPTAALSNPALGWPLFPKAPAHMVPRPCIALPGPSLASPDRRVIGQARPCHSFPQFFDMGLSRPHTACHSRPNSPWQALAAPTFPILTTQRQFWSLVLLQALRPVSSSSSPLSVPPFSFSSQKTASAIYSKQQGRERQL